MYCNGLYQVHVLRVDPEVGMISRQKTTLETQWIYMKLLIKSNKSIYVMMNQYSYTQLLRRARNELSVFPWKMPKAGSFLKMVFNIATLSLSFSLSLLLSLSLSSLSLFLSPLFLSLWLQDTCHLMPFTKYSLLDQSYFFTSYLSIAHIKFSNYSPTIFYDYHPQSCLKIIFFALGPTVV